LERKNAFRGCNSITRFKIIVYLDDGWSINSSYEKAVTNSNFIQVSLRKSGFLPNDEKSVWTPVQNLTWLGHIFNLERGYLKITKERVDNLKQEITKLKNKPNRVTSRSLAKIAGMLASMHFVLGDLTRLMTRFIYNKINESHSWDSVFSISRNDRVIGELDFWSNNLDKFNYRNFFPTKQVSVSVYSDASDVACASFSPSYPECIAHKQWSDQEKTKSSTWRELKCIEWGLISLSKFFVNKHVQWFTDSKNCEIIVQSGSSKTELQSLALSIFHFCIANQTVLAVSWIPR
jgi:hypothetical protein